MMSLLRVSTIFVYISGALRGRAPLLGWGLRSPPLPLAYTSCVSTCKAVELWVVKWNTGAMLPNSSGANETENQDGEAWRAARSQETLET